VPKAFYRRQLPHLQRDGKPHFLTFCTNDRWILPEAARSIVLECCLHDEGTKLDIQVVVVMPDHAHMIFTPMVNQQAMEVYSLAEITDAIKGASAHKINRAMRHPRTGVAARIFRPCVAIIGKSVAQGAVPAENPVRRGLAAQWENYPWIWQKPFTNPYVV
jgi:REP element-mobilizing transposase RayT